MTETSFTMHPLKKGRIKYLLLTLIPPLLALYLIQWLLEAGIFPQNESFAMICTFLPIAGLAVLGYFLIFKKNHVVTVENHAITNRDWRGKTTSIQANQIRSIRRNFLQELQLLDEDGNVLLCVEPNMHSGDLFEQWLDAHHIE